MLHDLHSLGEILNKHPDIKVSENEPMSRHTTFKVGGPAELFVEAKTMNATMHALNALYLQGIRPMIIGNGSNLLVSDQGIKGAVVKIGGGDCMCNGDVLTIEAGASMARAARAALREGLSGLEFAYGIPGTLGGAVVMNAGAYDGEISDCLTESSCIDKENQLVRMFASDHEFGYRTSYFKTHPNTIVLSSSFRLERKEPELIRKKMEDLYKRRCEKQPLEYPSAGSIFKRPPGHFAGGLIEQCGLKGYRIGGAQVSEKHAGFIINTGGATCDDILRLIEHIQRTVLRETGVRLECEVCRV